ncbi:UNVERIFIED_ORG: hypothetical protein GGE64_005203 [Rhizobium etli]
MKEVVNHPAHYGGEDNPYEVIKVLENWLTREEFIGALKFNIIKYQARARLKAGSQVVQPKDPATMTMAEILQNLDRLATSAWRIAHG